MGNEYLPRSPVAADGVIRRKEIMATCFNTESGRVFNLVRTNAGGALSLARLTSVARELLRGYEPLKHDRGLCGRGRGGEECS